MSPLAPRGQPARDALPPLGDLVPGGDEPLWPGLSRDGARSCPREGWGAAGGCELRRGQESPGTAAAGKVPSKMPKRAPTPPGTHRSTAGPWELLGDKGGRGIRGDPGPGAAARFPGREGEDAGCPCGAGNGGLGSGGSALPLLPPVFNFGRNPNSASSASLFGGAPRYVPFSP